MRHKKILRLLKQTLKDHSSKYSEDEINYMKEQLQIIEDEIKKIEHKNYKGFGKNEIVC